MRVKGRKKVNGRTRKFVNLDVANEPEIRKAIIRASEHFGRPRSWVLRTLLRGTLIEQPDLGFQILSKANEPGAADDYEPAPAPARARG